jgi:hypothetical protein
MLGVEVWLDQTKLIDVAHVREKFTVTLNTADSGSQELKIILKNKTAADTEIGENNNIVRDSCLMVNNFKFDGVDGDQLVSKQAVYRHDFNATQSLLDDEFYWCMGCNGIVSIKFSTPLYIWLLENM